MLSANKATASITAVRNTPLEAPDLERAGPNWQGVRHRDLLDKIMEATKASNFPPTAFRGHLARNGAELFASWDLGPALAYGEQPSLGFISSNAGRRGLRFFIGVVAPFQGGKSAVVTGTYREEEWRYNQSFDLDRAVRLAFGWWRMKFARLSMSILAMKKRVLAPQSVDSIILTIGRGGKGPPMPWSRLGEADRLFLETNGLTAWDLLCCLGAAAGRNSPEHQMDQLLHCYHVVRDYRGTKTHKVGLQ